MGCTSSVTWRLWSHQTSGLLDYLLRRWRSFSVSWKYRRAFTRSRLLRGFWWCPHKVLPLMQFSYSCLDSNSKFMGALPHSNACNKISQPIVFTARDSGALVAKSLLSLEKEWDFIVDVFFALLHRFSLTKPPWTTYEITYTILPKKLHKAEIVFLSIYITN